MLKSKILFFVSGSIAGFKAAQVVSTLVQNGHEVQVIATDSALHFVGTATFEGLTGRPVLTSLWEEGHAMDHIHLTRWADLAVLCPASANTIARIANGLADDLVSAMALAWPREKPFFVFPAMNTQMLLNEATQKNLKTLSERGFKLAPCGDGNLACGEVGGGRLLEPDAIVEFLGASLTPRGHILVTSGATREPIDGVRFISNVSTGRTGAELVDLLAARGWAVTAFHGEGAIQPTKHVKKLSFTSFSHLNELLRMELSARDYTAVIHCAAVSDYSVTKIGDERANHQQFKISSDQELTLHLKPNFKILPRLKEYSRNKSVRVIGFKMTLNAGEIDLRQQANALLNEHVDAVVANDWSQVRQRDGHPGLLLQQDKEQSFTQITELVAHLDKWLAPQTTGESI